MKKFELKKLIVECVKEVLNEGLGIYIQGIDFEKENLKTTGGIASFLTQKLQVKFEPDENDYFDSVGTINLYANSVPSGKEPTGYLLKVFCQ